MRLGQKSSAAKKRSSLFTIIGKKFYSKSAWKKENLGFGDWKGIIIKTKKQKEVKQLIKENGAKTFGQLDIGHTH